MRMTTTVAGAIGITLLAGMTGCGKSGSGAGSGAPSASLPPPPAAMDHLPARKAGLWIQTMSHDGAPSRMGEVRMCLDEATDKKMSAIGQGVDSKMPCTQSATRLPDGSFAFSGVCKMGEMGEVASKGTASGDFQTSYKIHSETDMTGPASTGHASHHVNDIEGRYAGPCPAGMVAGDISLGGAMTVNVYKMPAMAAALGGH